MQKKKEEIRAVDLENIVFFDGVCVLCNSLVNFLMKIDKKHRLKYASLQGDTAKKILSNQELKDLKTIVFYSQNKLTQKSNAVLEIIKKIGGFWHFFLVLKIVPKFIRDGVYNWVAKNRYRWFGKKETCRLPLPTDKGVILP